MMISLYQSNSFEKEHEFVIKLEFTFIVLNVSMLKN